LKGNSGHLQLVVIISSPVTEPGAVGRRPSRGHCELAQHPQPAPDGSRAKGQELSARRAPETAQAASSPLNIIGPETWPFCTTGIGTSTQFHTNSLLLESPLAE
jgi:hypothetical protein